MLLYKSGHSLIWSASSGCGRWPPGNRQGLGFSKDLKMKIVFVLLLLLVPQIKGQRRTTVHGQMYGQVVMQFFFHPYYNTFEKLCFKFTEGRFIVVLSNRNIFSKFLNGRVSNNEYNGLMEIRIWNLQQVDAGDFRCVIIGTKNTIYHDFHLEIDTFSHRSQPNAPLPPVSSTIGASISSSSSETSGLVVSKDNSNNPSISWSLGLTLAAGLCISVLSVTIISVTAAMVHRRVRAKKKCGATTNDSADHIISCPPQEGSGVVYTTVDFRPNGYPPTELYANLQTIHSSRPPGRGHDLEAPPEHDGTVVYSTLASNPR